MEKKLNPVMENRLRVKVDCSEPIMTDQSYKKSSDINNIMKQYGKTQVLPNTREHLARYVDTSELPSLEEAHDIIMEAKELFEQLPSNVRKLMDNDPTKLVDFVKDPNNTELLVKNGVLEQTVIEAPSQEPPQDVKAPSS